MASNIWLNRRNTVRKQEREASLLRPQLGERTSSYETDLILAKKEEEKVGNCIDSSQEKIYRKKYVPLSVYSSLSFAWKKYALAVFELAIWTNKNG